MSDLVPNWKKKDDDEEEKENKGRVGAPDFMNKKDKEEEPSGPRVGAPDYMTNKSNADDGEDNNKGSTADSEDMKKRESAGQRMGAPNYMDKQDDAGDSEDMKQTGGGSQHTVVSGDTLSGIASKYYGSAERDKWMAIYEANKETIGDNPNLIRVGQELKIPDLG